MHKESGAEVAQAVHVIVGSFHDVEWSLQRDGFALGFVVSDSEGRDIDHRLLKMKVYGEHMVTAQNRTLLVIVNHSVRVVVVEEEQMDVHDNRLGRKWANHMCPIPAGHSPWTDVW